MAVKFHLNYQTHSTDCYRELNLLAHAQLEELDIGSRCGGHGICGGDKIKVEAEPGDLSPITDPEKTHLTPEMIQKGWRLACQCWPSKNHLEIQVKLK